VKTDTFLSAQLGIMKDKNAKKRYTIIFFDIRNFSEHRSRLAEHRRARLLTDFVREILNNAVELLEGRKGEFSMDPTPTLCHTGDGFLLILRGDRNPLLGLLWMSEFRRLVSSKIKEYQENIRGIFPTNPPKKLGFGIGAHYGPAVPVRFKSFGSSQETEGFIGSALNIASRVEQCTKDHVHEVLFTGLLLNAAREMLPRGHKRDFDSFWTRLGKHRLRGFEEPRMLYGFNPGFHRKWSEATIKFPVLFS
jgi:class 3 adenylate cyclase